MSTSFQDVLLKVKEGADIVQIVGQYVSLKRAGSVYKGVCPFHNDRDPSMNVNPRMGIYKCFACGAGGDAIKFVQEFEKLGFVEALRLVASKAGIAIPDTFGAGDKGGGEQTAAVMQANQIALQVYTESFEKTPAWQKYAEERGLARETIKHFQIGCAPESPDRIRQLAEGKKVPGKAFVEAGILGVAAGGRVYDRFGGRLVFPIFNLSGRVIAFGGRIAPGREGAKYINTPESPLYHKGRVLYGFNSARAAVDQSGEAVVVEGYMDLVTLWQFGVKNAVAVCGTALTKDHAQMLTRFAKKVFLFFDGDTAGRTAVRRSLEPLLAQGVEVRVPVLPGAEDPDSYARSHTPEELRALFEASDDLPGFLIRAAGKPPEALSAEQKDGVVREAAALLANHPSADVRESHLQSLRQRLGLRAAVPRGGLAARPAGKPVLQDGLLGLFVPESRVALKNEDKPEWQLLQLLLYHPEQTAEAAANLNLDWFFDERVREIVDYIQALLIEGGMDLRVLVERVPDPLKDALASIVALEKEEVPGLVLRKLGDYRDALELRYLRKEKLAAQTLAQAVEIQKRIDALNAGKVG
jgi:DNA primase